MNIDEYSYIFETLISTNKEKKASEILELLSKLVDNDYISRDVFNNFLKSECFYKLLKEYLTPPKIDIEFNFN